MPHALGDLHSKPEHKSGEHRLDCGQEYVK